MRQAEQCIRKGYGECFGNTQLEEIVKFGKEDIVFTLEKATEGTNVDLKKLQDSCEVIKGVTSAVGPHLWSGVNVFLFSPLQLCKLQTYQLFWVQGCLKSQREGQREPERARESQRKPERAREETLKKAICVAKILIPGCEPKKMVHI